jgi:drug/metabolite transporter (DMT)-like permease
MPIFGYLILIFITAFSSAFTINKINKVGASVFWILIPNLFTGLLWSQVSKLPYKLSFLAIAFDIFYSTSYVIALFLMGEELTLIQILGFFIAFCGVYLMK